MRQDLATRVRALMVERHIGLMEAKRIALLENADWAAQHALDALTDQLGEGVALYIDELIKARISQVRGLV